MPRSRAAVLLAAVLAACRSGLLTPECDSTHPCAASTDPCQIAFCTDTGQCARRPVSDGTECGMSDCITARACVAGVCAEVPATDGASCAPATPCRDAGRCVTGRCDTPPSRMFAEPRWEIPPTRPRAPLTAIAADAEGRFYWQECGDGVTCTDALLRSVDGAGALRFSLPVGGAALPAIVGDRLVRAGGCFRDDKGAVQGAFVESRALADGAIRWSLDTAALLAPPPPTSCHRAASSIVSDGKGSLLLVLGIPPTTTVVGSATPVGLDAASGAVRWSRTYPGYWNWAGGSESMGDGLGGIALRTKDDTIVLDSAGRERFRALNLIFPVAAEGGRLWGAIGRTGDGKIHIVYEVWGPTGKYAYELGPRQLYPMAGVGPVFAAGTGYTFDGGNDFAPGESLVGFDAASGAVRWRTPLAIGDKSAAGFDLLLTARDSLLFVQSSFTSCDGMKCTWVASFLREVTTGGAPVWACELPVSQYDYGTRGTAGTIALARGVVAIAGGDGVVRGYALPGAEPAAGAGDWTAAWGSVRRAGNGAL